MKEIKLFFVALACGGRNCFICHNMMVKRFRENIFSLIVLLAGALFLTSLLLLQTNGTAEAVVVDGVRKNVDEPLAGGTALQNDSELSLSLDKNRTYVIDGEIFLFGVENGGTCQLAFAVPSGATVKLGVLYGESTQYVINDTSTLDGPPCDTPDRKQVAIRGTVKTAGTSGNFILRRGTVGVPGTTTLEAGSYLKAEAI